MAHCNTISAQRLKWVPRHEFEPLAKQHHSGRAFWKASCWSQFTCRVMAFIKFQSKLKPKLKPKLKLKLKPKLKPKLKQSMQQILRLLQLNLFEKRDLMALLRGPLDGAAAKHSADCIAVKVDGAAVASHINSADGE